MSRKCPPLMVNTTESGQVLASKLTKTNSKSPQKREQDLKNSMSNFGSVKKNGTDFYEKENGLNKIETDLFYASSRHEKKQQFLDLHKGFFEEQRNLNDSPKMNYVRDRKK